MSKKRARDGKKEQDDALAKVKALKQERPLTADVFMRGIGTRRLHLACAPSFADGDSWDIRQRPDTWTLYHGVIPESTHRVRGCDRLVADPAELKSYFEEVCSLSLPLRPNLSGMGGFDGTFYQLAVFGDLHSEVRFQWWDDAPKKWKPMVRLAERMMKAFGTLPRYARDKPA